MTVIQLMLASEELDRLTVDHGQKINDLDLRRAMRSFDEPRRARQAAVAELSRRRVKQIVVQQTAADEARLAEKFTLHAARPCCKIPTAFPVAAFQGLRIEVDGERLDAADDFVSATAASST